MELSDEAYRKLMLEIAEARGKPRRRFSASGCVVWALSLIMFVVFMAALLPKLAETYPLPVLSHLFVTPQAVFSTPQAAPAGAEGQQAQPSPLPHYTPFYGAQENQAAPVFSGALPGATAMVEPTSGSFWTPEEETAFAATATAFIVDVPTAPPEFVSYTESKCRDPEIVAQSALLQAWCRK